MTPWLIGLDTTKSGMPTRAPFATHDTTQDEPMVCAAQQKLNQTCG
ncbi:hypothetical protein LG277_03720 [Vreelandella aquamarina]|nr:hypothetical protein [Halomonas sp.]